MRKISKDVRAIIEDNVLDQEASEEDDPSDDSQGQSKQNLLNNNNMSFQQSEIKKKKPVLQHVKPKEENEEINYSIHLLSDESLNKLKVRAVRLLRKASSPKILVTKENLKLVMLENVTGLVSKCFADGRRSFWNFVQAEVDKL